MMRDELVSIIMPSYNCSEYIKASIESVLKQTYKMWELIIVDDCSTDDTVQVIRDYAKNDSRIRLVCQEKNAGAAMARNRGIEESIGRYIAFIDGDDLWKPEKLKKQIEFMQAGNYAFTCTDYERIDTEGNRVGKTVKCRKRCGYNTVVWINPIGNSTVILDTEQTGKPEIPNIRKRNDFALWLKILHDIDYVYGLQEVLCSYLVRDDSISAKKKTLIKYQYKVFRELEHFSAIRAAFHVCMWGVVKILHIK